MEPRREGVEYTLDEAHGTLFILTNAGEAKEFKIVTAPVDALSRANWRDLLPHAPGRFLITMHAHARHLVRLEREASLPRIVVRRLEDGAEHAIRFEE